MNAPVRALPILLEPLPGEPLDSWIEAHAHRCAVSYGQQLIALGLVTSPPHPDHTVALLDAEAESITAATGVSGSRLHAMTLRLYDGNALVLHHQRAVNRALMWGVWRGSRYCPACLRERGGRWLLRWRLAWSFACTRHHVLLLDGCPRCTRQPRSGNVTMPRRLPPHLCQARPEPGSAHCGADLTAASAMALDPDGAILAAQQWIDDLLARAEELAGSPDPQLRTMFNDLRAVAGWALISAEPGDFPGLGSALEPASRLARKDVVFTPATVQTTAVGLTRAVSLIRDPDAQESLQIVRTLLSRDVARLKNMAPGTIDQRWRAASEPLQQLIWRAMDPLMGNVDRLRYRTATPAPRPPTGSSARAAAERARWIPQMLWPGWAVRLLPPSGIVDAGPLRRALSIALLCPGNQYQVTPMAVLLGHEDCQSSITYVLRRAVSRGEHAIFPLLCRIADRLDTEGGPIDYRRRRALVGPDLLTDADFHAVVGHRFGDPAYAGPAAVGTVRRYLYQRLTGNELCHAPEPIRSAQYSHLAAVADFPLRLTRGLQTALDRYATEYLQSKGIDEPLIWEPPASCADGLNLVGRDPADIDIAEAHRLTRAPGAAVTKIASTLNVGMEHLRVALVRSPPEVRPGSRFLVFPGDPAGLSEPFLRQRYLDEHQTIKQLAYQMGLPRSQISAALKHFGIARPPAGRFPITESWLRTEYLERGRPLPELATEAGISRGYLAAKARVLGIKQPRRAAARKAADTPPTPSYPSILQRALVARTGFNRLLRFQEVMQYPSISEAARHLGRDHSAIASAIRHLEYDLGTALYHRRPNRDGAHLRPTTTGQAVLDALNALRITPLTQRRCVVENIAPTRERTP